MPLLLITASCVRYRLQKQGVDLFLIETMSNITGVFVMAVFAI